MPRRTPKTEPAVAPVNDSLSPLELTALAKAPKGLAALRPRLEVGDAQAVDVTVRVRGVVSVASNSSATVVKTPPADLVLAAVISTLKPKARAAVAETLGLLFADYRKGGDLPQVANDAVDAADDLLRSSSREETQNKTGAVNATLAIELVKRHSPSK